MSPSERMRIRAIAELAGLVVGSWVFVGFVVYVLAKCLVWVVQ